MWFPSGAKIGVIKTPRLCSAINGKCKSNVEIPDGQIPSCLLQSCSRFFLSYCRQPHPDSNNRNLFINRPAKVRGQKGITKELPSLHQLQATRFTRVSVILTTLQQQNTNKQDSRGTVIPTNYKQKGISEELISLQSLVKFIALMHTVLCSKTKSGSS